MAIQPHAFVYNASILSGVSAMPLRRLTAHFRRRNSWLGLLCLSFTAACQADEPPGAGQASGFTPDFTLQDDQTHNKFSSSVEPAVRVPPGSVIEAFTHEATGGQLSLDSDVDDLAELDFDRVHTLTGPVYVEGAQPGDVLAVRLLEIESGDWGWMAVIPGFGFLAEEFDTSVLRTFSLDTDEGFVDFASGIRVPLRPFAGVMGVAPDTGDLLNTIPMRVVYEISVVKGGRSIPEPQYETDDYYATTGFATTIDEAARKATRYMIDYLVAEKGLSREDAYMLCSLAGDLKIAETVDVPHMLVAMHMPKSIFVNAER
jgi:acetamidase/formamidase